MVKDTLEHKIDSFKYKAKPGKKRVHRVLITNSGPCSTCPGKTSGDCQLPPGTTCYGEIPERQYPNCRPSRERQEIQWNTKSTAWYIKQIRGIQSRAKIKLTHHRLNEVHDWRNQSDMLKSAAIARANSKIAVKTFTHTSRKQIFTRRKYSKKIQDSTLVVNGSGFMAHNEYRVVPDDYQAQDNEYWCPDNCNKCSLCKVRGGWTILAKARHTKKSSFTGI